mgnify:FL=1
MTRNPRVAKHTSALFSDARLATIHCLLIPHHVGVVPICAKTGARP